MQPNIVPTRNSISQRVWRFLPAFTLASAAFLFFALPVLADGQSNEKSKEKNLLQKLERTYILGPVEVHLAFTDADGKQQEYSLAEAQPDFLKKLPLPLQAQSKSLLLNPKVRLFDGMWVTNSAAVCKEVVTDVTRMFPAGSQHEAYQAATYRKEPALTDLPLQMVGIKYVTEVIPGAFVAPSCQPFKVGFMNAYIDPSAPAYFPKYNSQGAEVIPVGGYPTNKVKQLQISFGPPPLNFVPFTLTTPCTCHEANGTCDKDPDFTLFFDVSFNVVVNSTELDSWKFGSSPQMQIQYYIGKTALAMRGGYEKQVADLEQTLERQLATDVVSLAADEFSVVTAIAQIIYDVVKYGIGGLYALSCDSQIYQTVDASLSGEFNTTTVAQMAKTADEAFKNLFVALDTASEVGFSKLDIELAQDRKKTLIFKLTYPTPAKPKMKNTLAAENKGIHLSAPSIGAGVQQVKPGAPFVVRGNNFLESYTNGLEISWEHTVAGIATTQVQWGPKGGQMKDENAALIPAVATGYSGNFVATNLNPGTTYQFRVHECDSITCAPWSDWLTASTEAGGSNDVAIWMDNNSSHPIGKAVLFNGSFTTELTIPAGTAPGAHTINAAAGAHPGSSPEASFDITVCGSQGCGPAISVVDAKTQTAMKPPINMMNPSAFTLRGDNFTPAVVVTVHLDSPTGPKIGAATPNELGIFEANFQLPYTSSGGHKLVAVQATGGRTIQAAQDVILITQPK